MKLNVDNYLILTEDGWHTYHSVVDIWEQFIDPRLYDGSTESIVFMSQIKSQEVYIINNTINTFETLKSFCFKILWGE